MWGTVVNSLAIVGGSLAGFLLKGGVPEKISKTVMNGLALCVLMIGITGASQNLISNQLLIVIFSIVIGGVIGEIIDIDRWLERLGDGLEKKLKGRGGRVSEGFVSASLLYCVGSMAIVGSLDSGLLGKYDTLYAKAVLDGISAIVFSSSMGIGVMLSAVSVFLYQGAITLAASLLKNVLVGTAVNNMSVVGGLLIIGIGLNMLGVTKIKLANLLPGIFLPVIYQVIVSVF